MDRRKFIGVFASSVVITRRIAEAQPAAKVYRVGFLLGATGESVASLFRGLKEGLSDFGYLGGRNLVFWSR